MTSPELRHDWSLDEIEAIYTAPFTDLIFRAQQVMRTCHAADQVQGCVLLSIKTGGCPEDCAYCPQSAHYRTSVGSEPLVPLEEMRDAALRAQAQGATRFCMGAAWRDAAEGPEFDRVLEMVRIVRGLGESPAVGADTGGAAFARLVVGIVTGTVVYGAVLILLRAPELDRLRRMIPLRGVPASR